MRFLPMRLAYLLAGLLSLATFVAGAAGLGDAQGEQFAPYVAFTLLSGLLVVSIGARILRHRGVPPALARTFFEDPAGWKIVPVGDPQSAARFEVVRTR